MVLPGPDNVIGNGVEQLRPPFAPPPGRRRNLEISRELVLGTWRYVRFSTPGRTVATEDKREEYLEKAKEAEEQGIKCRDLEARHALFQVAASYRRLAELAKSSGC